ncbi:putative baseplate assembly protein [Streptomyces sp. ME08-AFT2]|uniref:putative baseplate assembly protein n=1 Tax=Streptomyces sp. ME08-AFT2 TaxID=3028683 RepID=UPI0029A554AD|nr:putative baseplate assembly protein [Streptomyces sp. ME08-AFT2]MDX3310064.1 putative baseplate assembly protein [Streptomyces sp. ME08-AFT2]
MTVVNHPPGRPAADGPAGIHEVRTHPDRRTLTVTFFGVLPPGMEDRTRFVVEGGRRVVGIRVLRVARVTGREDEDAGSRLRLTLDRPGDDSTYRLRVLGRGFHGGHDRADFTFHPALRPAPSRTRGRAPSPAPGRAPLAGAPGGPSLPPAPAIDYLAKDYASFRRLLLERLSLTLPRWTDRHVPDLWVTLVELLAHVGDRLSYQQDAVATEAYLDTARLRTSVRRHARLVGYPMHDGCAARTVVCVETAAEVRVDTAGLAFTALPDEVGARPPGGPAGPVISPEALVSASYPAYQPLEQRSMRLTPAHNRMSLWAWGEEVFRLPAGATRAALLDGDGTHRTLDLEVGDLLVLEETHGPGGGPPDPAHRQAVRLTRAVRDVDARSNTTVVKIAWADEDALAFPLDVRNPVGPDGRQSSGVVARGNALLVEHGLAITWWPEEPGGRTGELVQTPGAQPGAADGGGPGRRRPVTLSRGPVTWSPPHPRPADVAAAQAELLLSLAAEARDGLRDLHHGAAGPRPESRELLAALFGPSFTDDITGLADDAERYGAVARFLTVFDAFFEPRLRRLEALARRARAGYVLDREDAGWEIAQAWGALAVKRLNPARPALHGPVSAALRPDPREALPALTLAEDLREGPYWTPRRDLLDSGPRDRHLVAEADDEGTLALRFGDGRCGRAPQPGSVLYADYRVGNGRAGNAGSEAVNRIAHRSMRLDGLVTRVRNPVPATGGVDPEPTAEVRLAAPRAPFRTLLRAVTAEDYAVLAAARPGVQRAAASLRWNGSWYEADVALDPAGSAVPSSALLEEVRDALRRYRRIGHDVVVRPALTVPLDVALNVLVDPHHVTSDVREALMRRFLPGRRPGGEPAFFDPAALSFGTPVRTSALVAQCLEVPGVRHAEVTRLARIHGLRGEAPGQDVPPSGELRMGPLEVPRLDGDVTRQENGWLTLRLRGGR